jgi:hypothetical protein
LGDQPLKNPVSGATGVAPRGKTHKVEHVPPEPGWARVSGRPGAMEMPPDRPACAWIATTSGTLRYFMRSRQIVSVGFPTHGLRSRVDPVSCSGRPDRPSCSRGEVHVKKLAKKSPAGAGPSYTRLAPKRLPQRVIPLVAEEPRCRRSDTLSTRRKSPAGAGPSDRSCPTRPFADGHARTVCRIRLCRHLPQIGGRRTAPDADG